MNYVIDDAPLGINEMILTGIDTSAGPLFNVASMAEIFFTRTGHWIRWLEKSGRMVLDGEEIEVHRSPSAARQYDLTTIEKVAHALASNGTITVRRLRWCLSLIRTLAEMNGYLEESYTRVTGTPTIAPEPKDPTT